MNDKPKHKRFKVETYNFGSDFQILTSKEKRGILRNAKNFLKLQKDNEILLARTHLSSKATDAISCI
jgi:hypothetical protein